MKKRIFLIVVMTVLLVSAVSANNGEVKAYLRNFNVNLDGKLLKLKDVNGNKVMPVVINGTTYLPVRAIGDSLGLEVAWEKNSKTVILKRMNKEVAPPKVSVSNIDKLLKAQPTFIEKVEYVKGDSIYKSLYPDALKPTIKNNSGKDIKNAVVAFVAWDKNGLPTKIKGNFDFFGSDDYVKTVKCNDINLVHNATYNDGAYDLDQHNSIHKFKAMVVSTEDFEGNIWRNPYYEEWRNLYDGKKNR